MLGVNTGHWLDLHFPEDIRGFEGEQGDMQRRRGQGEGGWGGAEEWEWEQEWEWERAAGGPDGAGRQAGPGVSGEVGRWAWAVWLPGRPVLWLAQRVRASQPGSPPSIAMAPDADSSLCCRLVPRCVRAGSTPTTWMCRTAAPTSSRSELGASTCLPARMRAGGRACECACMRAAF